MESFPALFPPVKRQTNPSPTITLEPSAKNSPDAVSVADYSAFASSSNSLKPPQPPPLCVPPGHVVFRLLCHASRVGGLIGKSGSIIKKLQQQTKTRIRVEDSREGSDQRVISVMSSSTVANRIILSAAALKEGEENIGGTIDSDGGGDDWFDVSTAQEGVVRVFERVVEVAADGDPAAMYSGTVSCKLLVHKNQCGAVIGKGGMVVEKIKKDTGCRIMVLHPEAFSPASFTPQAIVEIEGSVLSVKKALVLVTGRIQEFPPLGKTTTLWNKILETEPLYVTSRESPIIHSTTSSSIYHNKPDGLTAKLDPKTPQAQQDVVVFMMLCPSDRVSGIIGKGGSIIEAIKNKTGASISIGPPLPGCDERLITIAAKESRESLCSPARNAAILVFKRCMEAGLEKGLGLDLKGSSILARVIVPSYQAGSLLGKGGAIISEMRKATGTGLRFIGGNQVPKCAPENVEILQMTGEFENVQSALLAVTSRLRDNMFSNYSPGNYNALSVEDSAYGGSGKYPPAFRSLDISDNPNRDEPLTQSMADLQISTSPSLMDHRPIVVPNTAIEVLVPYAMIDSIYGENGSNLDRLRQISGAKVDVHEPRPGTNQCIVVISGTPDEARVAQSLMQAFLLARS